MEISQNFYEKVLQIVTTFTKDETYELEAKYKGIITRDIFNKTVQYFISVYSQTEEIDVLDISVKHENHNYRISVIGKEKVSDYCKTNLIPDDVIVMRKIRETDKRIEYNQFNFNIDLAKEILLEKDKQSEILEVLHTLKKGFRYKKRFSFIEDKKLRYDMTIVKTSKTLSGEFLSHEDFSKSGVTSATEKYEIELEIIDHSKINLENKTKLFISSIIQLYSIINDEDYVITEEEKKTVFLEYLDYVPKEKKKPSELIKPILRDRALKSPQDYFLGPQPVTLELKNIMKPDLGIVSILENYTVTEKADGERCNMFINSEGKCYIINNRLSIKYTGVKLEQIKDTIFDGEYITRDINGNITSIFAIFDVYYYNGKLVADLPLIGDESRYDIMKKFATKTEKLFKNNIMVVCKEFKYSDDIMEKCREILDSNKQKSYPYKVDGLIFTPKTFSVGGLFKADNVNLMGTWPLTFKWKPPEDNTVDFLVRYQKGEKGAFTIKFTGIKGYKILNLYVGYNPAQWTEITARNYLEGKLRIINDEYIEKLFKPADVEDTFSQCVVESKKEFNGKGVCENNDEIEDNSIVEFRYDIDTKSWVPIRVRKDKTEKFRMTNSLSRTANDYGSALNIWRSILNPVTEELIIGKKQLDATSIENISEDMYYYRTLPREKMASKKMLDFHNYWIKNRLLKSLSGKESIMDIACGQAGDLFKWREADFKKVFGIDYARHNIQNPKQGAYSRLIKASRDMNFTRSKHVFLTMDGGEKINQEYIEQLENEDDKYIAKTLWGLNKNIPDSLKQYDNYVKDGFDVVSCQFSIHYFFESEEKLDNFVYNVNSFLKNGGYFVGTCIDGQKIKKLLKGKKKGASVTGELDDRTLWKIFKQYDNNSDDIEFGESIDVYMESIGKLTKEYLVSFTKLIEKLKKYKIVLATKEDLDSFDSKDGITSFETVYNKAISTDNAKYLDSVKNMTEVEKKYSFLGSYFVFVKKKSDEPRIIKRKIIIKE